MQRKPAKDFQDLIVWQKAHRFVLSSYHLSNSFPANQTYGLTSQFRRAAISIPANIAEGFKKRTKPHKARYMNIAQASLEECRYYLILAKDLGYGDTGELMSQLKEGTSHLKNADQDSGQGAGWRKSAAYTEYVSILSRRATPP